MAKFAPHPTLFALKRDANDAMMINKVKLVWGTEQRKAVLDGEGIHSQCSLKTSAAVAAVAVIVCLAFA